MCGGAEIGAATASSTPRMCVSGGKKLQMMQDTIRYIYIYIMLMYICPPARPDPRMIQCLLHVWQEQNGETCRDCVAVALGEYRMRIDWLIKQLTHRPHILPLIVSKTPL